MHNCAIVGICWGDEGKGRMVDYLVPQFGTVVRYQGGNNAGHTIVTDQGEFKLNLIPSGILHPDKMNLLGAGCVVDLHHVITEMEGLRARGVAVSPDNLRISDRATAVLPISPLEDKMEEQRLGKAHFGSTLRGIAPAYADRAYKKALRMGDLLHEKTLETHLQRLVDWKNEVTVSCWPTARSMPKSCVPISATLAACWRNGRIRASCLRPSWARCAIWTTAFIPIRLLPRRWLPTRRWAAACPVSR